MPEFEPWPKIPRWNRPVIVTEKVDGTNAAILIQPVPDWSSVFAHREDPLCLGVFAVYPPQHETPHVAVYAQSRTRFLSPGTGREAGRDNYGFAAWVAENAVALVGLLGPGRHFGEWYGKGIARGYGLDHKRFALFNVHRWSEDARGYDGHPYQLAPGLPVDVVPTLAQHGRPDEAALEDATSDLQLYGSKLVPGFMRPEGVILYHTAAKQLFKVLLESDEIPKSAQG